jgi:hypothetical protein
LKSFKEFLQGANYSWEVALDKQETQEPSTSTSQQKTEVEKNVRRNKK